MHGLLRSIPGEAYAAVASAVLTAAVTLLAVYLNNRAHAERLRLQLEDDARRRRAEAARARAEEVNTLAQRYCAKLWNDWIIRAFVIGGSASFRQATEMINKPTDDPSPDFDRLEMLVQVHFPSLKTAWSEIKQTRDAAVKIIIEHAKASVRGSSSRVEYLEPLFTQIARVADVRERFRHSCVVLMRDIEAGNPSPMTGAPPLESVKLEHPFLNQRSQHVPATSPSDSRATLPST